MTIRYGAFLQTGADASTACPVDTFRINEQYNGGWSGYAVITARSESEPIDLGTMFYATLDNGIEPGVPATLMLAFAAENTGEETTEASTGEGEGGDTGEDAQGAPPEGWLVRAWPCMVVSVEPFHAGDNDPTMRTASSVVRLVDPVSYLAARPVWGAYRGCSAGAMIGGALSMAAGGDGKPGLEPVLPGMSLVTLVERTRDEVARLPYAIASGQTLGEWLGELCGLLGLRVEMLGNAEGRVTVGLTDQEPGGTPVSLTLRQVGETEAESETPPGPEEAQVQAIAAHPGEVRRDGLLDDPTLGAFRHVGLFDDPGAGGLRPVQGRGSIGRVLSGTGIGVDEAAYRMSFERAATHAEMLMMQIATGQPGLRPGRTVVLSESFMGIDTWQLHTVVHAYVGRAYLNDAILLPSDVGWHPAPPGARPPRFVTGQVDGGTDVAWHEPVERDRLGRIPVSFAFAPTPMGEEAATLAAADADRDRRITLDDFTDTEKAGYEEDAATWDEEIAALESGAYDDPYPGRADDDLTAEERADRNAKRDKRREARKARAYRQAKAQDALDRDRDGWVTARDRAMSQSLEALMADPGTRAEMEAWSSAYRSGGVQGLRNAFPDNGARPLAHLKEIIEYGALFHGDAGPGVADDDTGVPTELEDRYREGALDEETGAFEDAELADERWPARVPLAVVAPMAGTLHGFIHAHRQGDVCRVAVHNALYAEVIGFQYRANRRINVDLTDATAGLVVEHNLEDSWSGVMFRPSEALETASEGDGTGPGDDDGNGGEEDDIGYEGGTGEDNDD